MMSIHYKPELMGSAEISPTGKFEAGSYGSFTLTYTAGYFGIDDTGSIKIVHRFASDMGRPQFIDPKAPNFTTVEASNGAVLHLEYDIKRNVRPWDKTLYIKVVRGFLREGDQIIVRFGDQRKGSPGIRVQTFCENTFEFKVLVDAFATYQYTEVNKQPTIEITPGPPAHYKAVLPTLKRVGEAFRCCLKGDDKWGNPSNRCQARFRIRTNHPIDGLPELVDFKAGESTVILDGLSVGQSGDVVIEFLSEDEDIVFSSNPLRVVEESSLLAYWGDLHGQSEETIGTNTARDFFEFARDKAFLDVACHQGNDFQITNEFWAWLNELSAEFNEDDEFVVFPGYEWSGNTGLGGDRNVLYLHEHESIHRSSHALVEDLSDVATDANSAEDLFSALKNKDCVVFAHVGGRYADIEMSHDKHLERAVEVHSAWGTFEWLIHDAFNNGYRVGIVSNSDGHKGRPGASHPGATKFGAYGGLTCLLAPRLNREGLMESLRRRHHYGTTGCRMHLVVRARFDAAAECFDDDPNLGPTGSEVVMEAMMGDILHSDDPQLTLSIDAHAAAPVERIEIRNGVEVLETFRPYDASQLGRRIRVIWEGSEYRGRGRQTVWDGSAQLNGNAFKKVAPINFWNLDKRFEQTGPQELEWSALTTGGFGGFDAWLEDPAAGTLKIDTALVQETIKIADIGLDDLVFENGGIDRRIRVFRLPDENPHRLVRFDRRVQLASDRDNALYVCLTQEDGHRVWSSPIYIIGR